MEIKKDCQTGGVQCFNVGILSLKLKSLIKIPSLHNLSSIVLFSLEELPNPESNVGIKILFLVL